MRHSFTVLGDAHLSLTPLAVSAEILSLATLARLQRRLLRAGGCPFADHVHGGDHLCQ